MNSLDLKTGKSELVFEVSFSRFALKVGHEFGLAISFHAPYSTDRIPGAVLTYKFGLQAIEPSISPLDFLADGALYAGKALGALGRSVGGFESAAKGGEFFGKEKGLWMLQ